MILKVRKDFMVFKQSDFIAKWFTVVDFHTLEAMFLLTTTEEKEAALSLFSELGISSQDQFCLEIEVNLWRKKRKANNFKNCTSQQVNMERNTVLQINNAHLDRSRCWQHLHEATKTPSHSPWVDEANKALCFFSERGVIWTFNVIQVTVFHSAVESVREAYATGLSDPSCIT